MSIKRLKTFFVILLGFFVLPGCAALDVSDTSDTGVFDVSDTKDVQASQSSISNAKNGLTVTVDLIQDEVLLKKYFGADLSKKGILPVHIRVVNDSDSSYLFLNQKIGQSNAPTDKRGNAGGDYEATLISTGPLFAAFKDTEGERAIRRNVLAKRLKTNMLSPGEQRSGFLYFKVDKAERVENTATTLTLNFLSLTTRKTNEFVFVAEIKKERKP